MAHCPPEFAAGQTFDPDAADSESGSEYEGMPPQVASASEADTNPYQAENEDPFREAAKADLEEAQRLEQAG